MVTGTKLDIIKYAENTGAVIGWGNLGGIAGVNNSKGTIENAVNKALLQAMWTTVPVLGGSAGSIKGQ